MVAALATHAHLAYLRQTNSRRTSDGGIIVAERVRSVARRLGALAVLIPAAFAIEVAPPVLTRTVGELLSGAAAALMVVAMFCAVVLVWVPKRSTLRVSSESVRVRTGLGRTLVVPLEMVSSATLEPMPSGPQSMTRGSDGLDTSKVHGAAKGDSIRFDYVAQDVSARSFIYVTAAAGTVVEALRHFGVPVESDALDEPRGVTTGDA